MQSLAAALISRILPGRSEDIDDRLAAQFGRRALASFHEYFADRQNVTTIESQHDEDLNNIVHVKRPRWATRRIKGAPSMAWPTGPGEEIYLPIDGFWVCATPSAEGRGSSDRAPSLRARASAHRSRSCAGGTSKEWVHRSVQIALEQESKPVRDVVLRNDDFRHAMREMRKFSEGSTGKIIGFHVR